jgi:1,4-alpha-glucan branching enzyme
MPERLWNVCRQYQERPEEDKSPYQVYLVSSAPETTRPVAAFTRDPTTGLQVWSGEWGYPGDGNYLDFHKKRFPGGLRYWQVTSAQADLADKQPYHPEWVAARINDQADHFVSLVSGILTEFKAREGRPGMVVAPYDTELIGHWSEVPSGSIRFLNGSRTTPGEPGQGRNLRVALQSVISPRAPKGLSLDLAQ